MSEKEKELSAMKMFLALVFVTVAILSAMLK
jgi:hypothetical protein